VTNGTQEHNTNNQPVIKDGVVMVHNGIVCNVDALWDKHRQEIERSYEVDTEVIAARYRSGLQQGSGPAEAIKAFFGELEGAASVAVLADDIAQVLLCTNTGSLYYLSDGDAQVFVFASEEYILRTFRDAPTNKSALGHLPVIWMEPFTGLVIAQEEHDVDVFTFGPSFADPS
jgi:glucosamine 6-phosphate synthetase-like amidotransferase/phosphosugar isomerase protein